MTTTHGSSILRDFMQHDSILSAGLVSCSRVYLMQAHEAIKWIFRMMWRYRLMWNRCRGDQCRGSADRLRCAATRRHPFGTGTVLQTAHLEKRALNRVNISNKCRVFQCTVNWARARLRTTLIASGASGSSAIWTVGVTGFQRCKLCRCFFVLVEFFHQRIDGFGRTERENAVAGIEDG